jgi:hypothetical protein
VLPSRREAAAVGFHPDRSDDLLRFDSRLVPSGLAVEGISFGRWREILSPGPAVRRNLRVKLEEVTLTSGAELSEPSSFAYQRNRVTAEIALAAEQFRKSPFIGEVLRSRPFFEVPFASEKLHFLS